MKRNDIERMLSLVDEKYIEELTESAAMEEPAEIEHYIAAEAKPVNRFRIFAGAAAVLCLCGAGLGVFLHSGILSGGREFHAMDSVTPDVPAETMAAEELSLSDLSCVEFDSSYQVMCGSFAPIMEKYHLSLTSLENGVDTSAMQMNLHDYRLKGELQGFTCELIPEGCSSVYLSMTKLIGVGNTSCLDVWGTDRRNEGTGTYVYYFSTGDGNFYILRTPYETLSPEWQDAIQTGMLDEIYALGEAMGLQPERLPDENIPVSVPDFIDGYYVLVDRISASDVTHTSSEWSDFVQIESDSFLNGFDTMSVFLYSMDDTVVSAELVFPSPLSSVLPERNGRMEIYGNIPDYTKLYEDTPMKYYPFPDGSRLYASETEANWTNGTTGFTLFYSGMTPEELVAFVTACKEHIKTPSDVKQFLSGNTFEEEDGSDLPQIHLPVQEFEEIDDAEINAEAQMEQEYEEIEN